MNVIDISDELLKLLELKLTGEVDNFNAGNLTYNVLNNLMTNLFAKAKYELKQSDKISHMTQQELNRFCLENAAHTMTEYPKQLKAAFTQSVIQNQKEEIHSDSIKLGEYLIGALPFIIEEFLHTNEYFNPKSAPHA